LYTFIELPLSRIGRGGWGVRGRGHRLDTPIRIPIDGLSSEGYAMAKAKEIKLSAEEMGCGDFAFAIVGESYYQPAIHAAMAKAIRNKRNMLQFAAVVIRETDNPVDKDAIAVYAAGGGKIGHFSEEDAQRHKMTFLGLAANKKVASCQAIIIGETMPTQGVVLDFNDDGVQRAVRIDTPPPGRPAARPQKIDRTPKPAGQGTLLGEVWIAVRKLLHLR
jgi:hypothetical protein